jgi:hypothetical protein
MLTILCSTLQSQDENIDLEEEEDVTGFLGVHIKE